jgi:hypothetical protein
MESEFHTHSDPKLQSEEFEFQLIFQTITRTSPHLHLEHQALLKLESLASMQGYCFPLLQLMYI